MYTSQGAEEAAAACAGAKAEAGAVKPEELQPRESTKARAPRAQDTFLGCSVPSVSTPSPTPPPYPRLPLRSGTVS